MACMLLPPVCFYGDRATTPWLPHPCPLPWGVGWGDRWEREGGVVTRAVSAQVLSADCGITGKQQPLNWQKVSY